MDRRYRYAIARNRVEVRSRTGVLALAGRADPVHGPAPGIIHLDEGLGAMTVAESSHLEALNPVERNVRYVDILFL